MRVKFPRCPIPACKEKRMDRIYARGPHGFKGIGWICPRCQWVTVDKK